MTYIDPFTLFKTSNEPTTYDAFMLRFGKFFDVDSISPSQTVSGNCFGAAISLASTTMDYCEGVITASGIEIPKAHAWCCTGYGDIEDYVMGDKSNEYYGIRFNFTQIVEHMAIISIIGIRGLLSFMTPPEQYNFLNRAVVK